MLLGYFDCSYCKYLMMRCVLSCFFTCMSFVMLASHCAFANDEVPKRATSSGQVLEVVDSVIASIEGEPITMGELRRFVNSLGLASMAEIEKNQEMLKQALNEMIAMRLYEKEATSLGVVIKDEDVEAYVDQIKQQNGFSQDQFLSLLKSKGLSFDDYKEQIKREISKTRVMQSKVQSSVQILDEDVDRFIAENPKIAPNVGDVHLFQIMVENDTVDGRDKDSKSGDELNGSSNQCVAYRPKLTTMESWPAVGRSKFSDVGYVSVDALRDELRDVVNGLKEREVSNVITTPDGCYLVMVVNRATEPNVVDKAQREQIRNKLYQDKVQERLREFVSTDLPKKYHVMIML